MKKMIPLLIIIFIISIIIAYFVIKKRDLNLETIKPSKGKIVQAVYANGEIESIHSSSISSQTNGQITSIFVEIGQKINKGQLLAQLDDSVEVAKVNELKSRLVFLKNEATRYQNLLKKNDGYTSVSKAEEIQNQFETAKAQLLTLNETIEKFKITAPITGVLLDKKIEIGESTKTGEPIFWIGELKNLRIVAEVDEEDISLIQLNQKALIKSNSFSSKTLNGFVTEIIPKGNPVDKNFRVHISLPNEDYLMIGMTVEVNIITKEESDALLIPSISVVKNQVWVISDGKIEKREIKKGIVSDKKVQVISGLDENDLLILNPSLSIKLKEEMP